MLKAWHLDRRDCAGIDQATCQGVTSLSIEEAMVPGWDLVVVYWDLRELGGTVHSCQTGPRLLEVVNIWQDAFVAASDNEPYREAVMRDGSAS